MAALSLLQLTAQPVIMVDQRFTPPESEVRLDTQVGVAPFLAGAQTFTPSVEGELAGFDFWIKAIGGEPIRANLQVRLETTTAKGKPSGTSLEAVVLPPAFLDEQPGIYKHIEFGGVHLQAGQLYAVVFQAVPYVSGGNAAYDFRGYSISVLGVAGTSQFRQTLPHSWRNRPLGFARLRGLDPQTHRRMGCLDVGTDRLFNHVDRNIGDQEFERELRGGVADTFWKAARSSRR